MDKPISNRLKTIFLVYAILAVIVGLMMWVAPGRVLTLVGWVEAELEVPGTDMTFPGHILVDPYITRGLGAAFFAMAFTSFLGWRANRWNEVAFTVKFNTVFCAFAFAGLILSLDLGNRPFTSWNLLETVFMVVFGIGFGWAWWTHSRE